MRQFGSGHFLMGILQRVRLEQVEQELAKRAAAVPAQTLREQAAELVRAGGNLTRQQTAAYLGISIRQLSRVEGAGRLRRCRQMGRAVMYAARDVLRIASASGKEQ